MGSLTRTLIDAEEWWEEWQAARGEATQGNPYVPGFLRVWYNDREIAESRPTAGAGDPITGAHRRKA